MGTAAVNRRSSSRKIALAEAEVEAEAETLCRTPDALSINHNHGYPLERCRLSGESLFFFAGNALFRKACPLATIWETIGSEER